METSTIVSVVFPVGIALVMLGLGLALQVSDFTRIFKSPTPVLVGLLSQVVALPIIGFLLCKLFDMPPELAVGMMVLSASPTGAMSNIFSRIANGDVALGLTLTALGGVLAAITLPLISGLAVQHFVGSSTEVAFQFRKTFEVVLIILLPVLLGMTIRVKATRVAAFLDRPLRIFSILVLILIIVGAVSKEWRTLTENLVNLGWIVATFNLSALGIGFFLPKLFKLPRNQVITITLGAGIHNAAIAIYLALSVLGSTTYALPSALYGVLMFFTGTALTVIFKKI